MKQRQRQDIFTYTRREFPPKEGYPPKDAPDSKRFSKENDIQIPYYKEFTKDHKLGAMVYSSSPLAVLASTKNGSFTFAQDEWIPNDITEGSIQIIEGNQVGAAIEANPDDGVLLVKGKGLLIWKQVEGIRSVEDRLSIVVAKVLYMLEAYEKIFKIELKRNTFYAIAPTAMQANVPQPAVNQSGGMDDE